MKLDELSINELISRALHASYRKKWNEALQFSEVAIKKAPNNYLAHKRYGLALWYLDKKKEAFTALKKSIELEPDFASGHYNLACFYANQSDKKNMLFHLEKAIALDEYSDFSKMALNDDDFEMYNDDSDFSALVAKHSEEINALQKVFESENIEIISEKLLSLGNDILVEAIDWDDSDVGAKIDELIEEKAHELNYETLLHVFKIIVNYTSIDYFESLYILGTELHKKNPQNFEQVIIDEWKNRYTYTDAGHLGQIDHDMLQLINDLLPYAKKGELLIWGLTSHGKDALQDYEELCVSLLEQLPEDHSTRHELVNIIDTYLHDNLYKHEDFKTRQQRVRMALPAPDIEVPDDTDDMWAREKIAIKHFDPATVINAAAYMEIQRNHPEVVELARRAIPAICNFAIDQTLPVDLRCEAIKVIDKLGDETEKITISPVFLEKSYMLLQSAGKALFNQ